MLHIFAVHESEAILDLMPHPCADNIGPTHCRRNMGSIKNNASPLLVIELDFLPGCTRFHTDNHCCS